MREDNRKCLFRAKEILLRLNGYQIKDLIDEGKSGKEIIKTVIAQNRKKFKEILDRTKHQYQN
jgi:hypothetical protein